MSTKIVVGLGWGDEGKGITTDYLCSKMPEDTIVVRFSGGQQAGHTVMVNSIKHVFQNFGAGTLRGCPSYFSEHCTIYPNTIQIEKEKLMDIGIMPQLYVHPLARVTTPFDVAINKMREKKNKHGSCGLGVGATMKRNDETPYKMYAIDLLNKSTAMVKIASIRSYYRKEISKDDLVEFDQYVSESFQYWISILDQLPFEIADYFFLKKFKNRVFEGSQGIQLDMSFGAFPHVTYGNTTSRNALEICNKLDIVDPSIYYVTRCYRTRHGHGPMGTYSGKVPKLINTQEEINVRNEWQGEFRIEEIDYDILNHSLEIDNIFSSCPRIHKNLVVTCLDQRKGSGFAFHYKELNQSFYEILESHSPDSETFRNVYNENTLIVPSVTV